MTARILLHGGNSNKKSDKNDMFYRDIVQGVGKDTVRILCVYFARPEGRWENSYAEDQSIFRAIGIETGIDVETTLATYDIQELLDVIAESDVIFINGGFKGHLKDTLLTIGVDNFCQMLQGKTLVGISAGANMMSKYYYSQSIEGVREGIGLLDIKLLTHYTPDRQEQMAKLQAYEEDLPIITIAEEEYIVY